MGLQRVAPVQPGGTVDESAQVPFDGPEMADRYGRIARSLTRRGWVGGSRSSRTVLHEVFPSAKLACEACLRRGGLRRFEREPRSELRSSQSAGDDDAAARTAGSTAGGSARRSATRVHAQLAENADED